MAIKLKTERYNRHMPAISYLGKGQASEKRNQEGIKKANPAYKPLKVHYQTYRNFNGAYITCVDKVGDGSIINRFNKTPFPEKPSDVICPHFLELKWAYGCPYKCAWCYLQGTFRFLKTRTSPVMKNRGLVERAVLSFLGSNSSPEMLNSGEIADSLMEEGSDPFSRFIIDILRQQDKHKILFLTKSDNIRNLLELKAYKQAVISFSINAGLVSDRWEKGAPSIERRLNAAKELADSGYSIRLRIDPIVPIIGWEEAYSELIDNIFDRFTPERITLGSLRGLQTTIRNSRDPTWVNYLGENSNWGKKVDFNLRYDNFSRMIDNLKDNNYHNVALCKETIMMWEHLGMNWKKMRCNCLL